MESSYTWFISPPILNSPRKLAQSGRCRVQLMQCPQKPNAMVCDLTVVTVEGTFKAEARSVYSDVIDQ